MTEQREEKKTLAPLRNVSRMLALIDRLQNRGDGVPGMGCFYGFSGLGKSMASSFAVNTTRAVHVQMKSVWTHKRLCEAILDELGVGYEARIVSAHRTPDRLWDYGKTAVSRGLKVIIAGAGGAAHLPGMMASKTRVPVIGVPVQTKALSGVDSLYSILQMPKGYPVATMAIGAAGAANAGLMAAGILALSDPALAQRLDAWRQALSDSIPEEPRDE